MELANSTICVEVYMNSLLFTHEESVNLQRTCKARNKKEASESTEPLMSK